MYSYYKWKKERGGINSRPLCMYGILSSPHFKEIEEKGEKMGSWFEIT
jgi:hypothetical protein